MSSQAYEQRKYELLVSIGEIQLQLDKIKKKANSNEITIKALGSYINTLAKVQAEITPLSDFSGGFSGKITGR